jgi:hypothetical protein
LSYGHRFFPSLAFGIQNFSDFKSIKKKKRFEKKRGDLLLETIRFVASPSTPVRLDGTKNQCKESRNILKSFVYPFKDVLCPF